MVVVVADHHHPNYRHFDLLSMAAVNYNQNYNRNYNKNYNQYKNKRFYERVTERVNKTNKIEVDFKNNYLVNKSFLNKKI
jgi:hypothetical protein